MQGFDEAAEFYGKNYDSIGRWILKPGTKIVLGDSQNDVCRFCGRRSPEVTFKLEAHAIPEALGNKSLSSTYECDDCNQAFGRGIENDLGNWSKPIRTFARIRGKSGVPTLKKSSNGGWRIEFAATSGFSIKTYEDDPIFEIDEAAKRVTFRLRRDTYVPVAVLKAFVKIGLTLMPEAEMVHFRETLAWIRETNHQLGFVTEFPVLYTFQPGPMPSDLIVAFLLRRKPTASDVPYAFLVLAYGNEVFQVLLPSPEQDASIDGKPITLYPFPSPGHPDRRRYGTPRTGKLDLTGRDPVKGEFSTLRLGFDEIQGGPTASGTVPAGDKGLIHR
jgi:hypothetical protein